MGEPIKSLQRMANGTHRTLRIQEGDLVYITTTPTTAMETNVAKTEDIVFRAGGTVKMISENHRVSGHANPDNLQLMLNLMKPKYFIPVQGEYRQLAAHAELAEKVGIPKENIFITAKGDVLAYRKGLLEPGGAVPADNVLIDGIGVGDIGNIVLRDRKILSEDGIFIAVVTINRREKKIVAHPQITSRGFVYVKTSRDLIRESADMITTIVEKHLQDEDFEWSKLKLWSLVNGINLVVKKCRTALLEKVRSFLSKGGSYMGFSKYTLRVVIAGILFYLVLNLLFPSLNFVLQILIAFVFFFGILWLFPSVRRFFIDKQ